MRIQSLFRYSISFLGATTIATGCASPPRVLTVKSEPAEANVCIKGKFNSSALPQEQQCVGTTPFEADKIVIQDKDGRKRIVHFNDLEKESFYLVLNRKGYSSESVTVPAWEHHVNLKADAPDPTIAAVAAIPIQKLGTVKITSEPVGALVYINDTLRGNTPFAYEGQAGMAKVKLEYPERNSYEGIMSVTSGESRELNIKLLSAKKEEAIAIKSSVRIDSVPAGALLYVDDSLKGNAPFVYAGNSGDSVRVKLEMNGYEAMEKTVKLSEAGKDMNVVLQLKPKKLEKTSDDSAADEVAAR